MNSNTAEVFRAPTEVHELLDELKHLREEVRTVSSKIARIERRVNHAFPNVSPKRSQKVTKANRISIGNTELLSFYDSLVAMARSNRASSVEAKLEELDDESLRSIGKELGIAMAGTRLSRKGVQRAIIQRIRESLMLTKHVKRPPNAATAQAFSETEDT